MPVRRFAVLLFLAALVAVPAVSSAGRPLPQETAMTQPKVIGFSFADPKRVNAIGFFVDSELEPIHGLVTGITGNVSYDPRHPASFGGNMGFGTEGVVCSNRRMTQVLAGADWLHIDENPFVGMSFDEVLAAERVDETTARIKVRCKLRMCGASLDEVIELTATHVPDGAGRRGAKKFGDLLVLRSTFSIDRTKFGLHPDGPFDKVGREIHLNVAIAGYSDEPGE